MRNHLGIIGSSQSQYGEILEELEEESYQPSGEYNSEIIESNFIIEDSLPLSFNEYDSFEDFDSEYDDEDPSDEDSYI